MPKLQIKNIRRRLFPVILLFVCWGINLLDCMLSSDKDVAVRNIITRDSFIFTLIFSILFYFKGSSQFIICLLYYRSLQLYVACYGCVIKTGNLLDNITKSV